MSPTVESTTKARRAASPERNTLETRISARVALDGTGKATVASGLKFLDHMMTALSRHSRIDIDLSCVGDIDVDDHHSVEDCALALGKAIDDALGDRIGIRRFGSAYAPLDEALARAVVDFSGRGAGFVRLRLRREKLSDVACENLVHFIESFAVAARATIHVDVLKGKNDHHKAEAAFKSLALALRDAVALTGAVDVPSTKGTLL